MERERLTRLVQDAAAVERSDLADLDALAQRFPWFAGAQVLRSVGVQKAGEVLSEETLRDAAAHVPSRTALFDVVRRSTGGPKPVLTKVEVEVPEAVDAAQAISEPIETAPPALEPLVVVYPEPVQPAVEVVAVSPVEAATPVVEDLAPVQPIEALVLEAPSLEAPAPPVEEEEQAVREAFDDLVDDADEPIEAPEEDPLERQILESALASAYDFTWTQDTPPRAPSPDPIPAAPDAVRFPVKGPLVSNAPLERKAAITRHGKLSFTDWLEADNSEFTPEAKPKPQVEPVPDAIFDWVRSEPAQQEDQVEERPIHIPQKPVVKPLPVDPASTSNLIDAFIKQQAPAPAAKTEFFTPQQAAKRSLDDKAGMVTETLARVYAKQGNIPKAIESYKRLALKYPEKSAYFAALQKELEAQLNK